MVVRITLNIKHIRGHIFQIECDHDADTLGLKVQIWELQKIPIENQRLVYGGRELQDGIELSKCNIVDGATLFLVETNSNINNNIPSVNIAAFNEITTNTKEMNEPLSINMPEYSMLDEETASNDRISYVTNLAYYARCYCVLGSFISLISTFGCLFSLVPLLIYLLGWIGTRKLNRCCLIFPLFITALVGIGGTMFVIYQMSNDFVPWLFVPLFICFLHCILFTCFCKLLCAINHLSNEEITIAKARIVARRRCCC